MIVRRKGKIYYRKTEKLPKIRGGSIAIAQATLIRSNMIAFPHLCVAKARTIFSKMSADKKELYRPHYEQILLRVDGYLAWLIEHIEADWWIARKDKTESLPCNYLVLEDEYLTKK